MSTIWLFNFIFAIFNIVFLHRFEEDCRLNMIDKGRIKIPIYLYIVIILLLSISFNSTKLSILVMILFISACIGMLGVNIFGENEFEYKFVFKFLKTNFFKNKLDFIKKVFNFLNKKN